MIEVLESKLREQEEELTYLREKLSKMEDFSAWKSIKCDDLEFWKAKAEKLDAKLHSGLNLKNYGEWKKDAAKALTYYLDAMYAAYLQETDIHPSHVILKVGVPEDGKALHYWFDVKDGFEVAIEQHAL